MEFPPQDRKLARTLGLPVVVLLIASAVAGLRPVAADGVALSAGIVEAAAGDVHRYAVVLRAGEALRVAVHQVAVDVAVTLGDPGGGILAAADGLSSDRGTEVVAAIADRPGRYAVTVSVGRGRGSYRLEIAARGLATEADRRWARAMAAVTRGDARPPLEARQALVDYEVAAGELARLGAAEQEGLVRRRIVERLRGLGRLDEAIGEARRARELFAAAGDRWQVVNLWLVESQLLELQSQPEVRRAVLQQALGGARALGDRKQEAVVLNDLGHLEEQSLRLPEALAHYRQALAIYATVDHAWGEAVTLRNVGRTYRSLGRLRLSLDYLDAALAAVRGLDRAELEGEIHIERAWTYSWLERPREALAEAARARALARRTGHRRQEALSYDLEAAVQLVAGDLRNATLNYYRALEILQELEVGSHADVVYLHLAAVFLAWGEPEEAISQLEEILPRLKRSGNIAAVACAHLLWGRAERARGQLEAAHRQVSLATELIEDARLAQSDDWLRTSFFSLYIGYFDFWIDLLADLHRETGERRYAEMAFEAAERASGRALLDAFDTTRAAIAIEGDPALEGRARELRGEIERLEARRPTVAHDARRLAALESRERQLVEELNQVSRRQQPPPKAATIATLATIREELVGPRTGLLAYHLGEENSYVWWITDDDLELHRLPPRRVVEAAVEQAHAAVARPGIGELRGTWQALAEVSELLLGPVAERLDEARELIVLADGELQKLPFAALRQPGTGPASGRLLVELGPLVRLPSASVGVALRRRPAAESRSLAIVADPVYGDDDPRFDLLGGGRRIAALDGSPLAVDPGSSSPQPSLDRLRRAADEARAIIAVAGDRRVTLISGFDASRRAVLGGALDGYAYLHFATHGRANERHAELGELVLAQRDRQRRPIDGSLRAQDVYQLDLQAELVTLAACETALGENIAGEGLVGLPQAFQQAGARRVVVSLWPIAEAATSELMTRFYRAHLRQGLPVAEALRRAQGEVRTVPRWSDPYYWAGFVVDGPPS